MEEIRRQYSEEFKKDAVSHSLTSEKTVEEVARDLGIAHINLNSSLYCLLIPSIFSEPPLI